MPEHDLRLLSLDGGGVRGLSTIEILRQLMETIDPESPPKPCDYFDMIGGTSTGGLIAIMLGRLQMTVDECFDAYVSLSDRIFQKQKHRITIKGRVQGRFNADELERAIKEIVVKQGLAEDTLLVDAPDAKCKVFVTATSVETGDTIRLTSYRSPRGSKRRLRTIKIWEAGRATSAASSFFDPIVIGDLGEGFIDGATGANNPIYELWNEAQDIWPSGSLDDKVKCLVSIGTGVPSLKPFKDDIMGIGKSLLAISTETEKTAERFSRDKAELEDKGRYYRFNVSKGLEDIGLEESKKKNAIVAATDRYTESQVVLKQMKACAGDMSGREYTGSYRTSFSLQGVSVVNKFVDRPSDMAKLEQALLPHRGLRRRQVFVLHGLGGMGKTQLAVEFARKHQRKFSSVFWLDGRTEDSLKHSIATCASRIAEGQIVESSRAYSATGEGDIDAVVGDVMRWLGRPDNTDWLLVFDNVDRDGERRDVDPDAYDVTQYLPADHGSVLITSRLAHLEQLGEASLRLDKVNDTQAQAMFQQRYGGSCDAVEREALFKLLDGLPLAIAQAASYLRQTGVSVSKYMELYDQQWATLMQSQAQAGTPLLDYPNRSVWTTWTISYCAIRARSKAAANLLLLWACLDNRDVWYGLLGEGSKFPAVARLVSRQLPGIASNEVEFFGAMQLLRSYSLVEDVQEAASYTTHPVVHRWAFHMQGEKQRAVFTRLAVVIVGSAVDDTLAEEHATASRRLLPHALRCWQRIEGCATDIGYPWEQEVMLTAISDLGMLFRAQGKLDEAQMAYQRALRESEQAILGQDNPFTLEITSRLGNLYWDQENMGEAGKMYRRALDGYTRTLGQDHLFTLGIANRLGGFFTDQGKLDEAEQMYQRALDGYMKAVGQGHPNTLSTLNNLGILYKFQGKEGKAEEMYQQALEGYEKAFKHDRTLVCHTLLNLGSLYSSQGKLVEAEKMLQRALEGCEKAVGRDHLTTLLAAIHLGDLYKRQRKLSKAEQMYQQALEGYEKALGPDNAAVHTHVLGILHNLGLILSARGNVDKARAMYSRALAGYTNLFGQDYQQCRAVQHALDALSPITSTTVMSTDAQSDGASPLSQLMSHPNVPGIKAASKRRKYLQKLGWG